MRKPETRKFYAVDVGGKLCPMHAVEGLQPDGAQEITEDEARSLSAALRASEPKPVFAPDKTRSGASLEQLEAVAHELLDLKTRFDALARAIAEGAPK